MSEGTKAITFEDDGLNYCLRVEITETVCDENGPVYPQLVDERDATPADLAAVLAQHPELLAAVLPSAEDLAREIQAKMDGVPGTNLPVSRPSLILAGALRTALGVAE